ESDSSVVPMKLGNADGGKASYQLSPLLGTNLLHTEVGKINGNKTTKDSRISEFSDSRIIGNLQYIKS
ncbi:hypothetical protein ACLM5H_22355, partial [Fredinandcohnia humi]